MENFLGTCNSFMTFLCYKGGGQIRTNFPRKQAIIFAAEVVEVWIEVERYCTQGDTQISRCSRLSFALTVLAESCKGKNGIAAFTEVLQIIVELCAQIKQENESINALLERIRICTATIETLKKEQGSPSEMHEQGKAAGVPATASEATGAVDATSSNPLIDPFRSLSITDGNHDPIGRKLDIIRYLISKGDFKCVKSVRQRKHLGQDVIELFHTGSSHADLSAELDNLRSFLSGFQVVTSVYVPPVELSLIRSHRNAAELSLALQHRRLFSCDKRPVRTGNPIFSDEITSDGWTNEVLGTLGFVVQRRDPDGDRTIYSIVTAAHNCRRNFEAVYGFFRGVGSKENISSVYPEFDFAVSDLPPHIVPTAMSNDVSGSYTNLKGEIIRLQGAKLTRMSPYPPPTEYEVFFKGAMKSACGVYKGPDIYRTLLAYACEFGVGEEGDSGGPVFYRNRHGEFVVFGIVAAKQGIRPLTVLVTPLRLLYDSPEDIDATAKVSLA